MNTAFLTRDDFTEALKEILMPLEKHFSDSCARMRLGSSGATYGNDGVECEALLRPLWGLIPLWAQGDRTFTDRYIAGIKAGTDPESPDYWGKCTECDSRFVEMTTLGLLMVMCPKIITGSLSENELRNLESWLLQINRIPFTHNNWLFFQIFVNDGLKKCGLAYSQEAIDRAFEEIDGFYLGNGWYSDGKTAQRDYYVAFAIHFYSLVYAATAAKEQKKRRETIHSRAKLFYREFIKWFSASGEAVPFGRSLTYRFAQCCFFSALVFADCEADDWGVIKGIICRHMRYWLSKPVFDNGGILTIGYACQNLNMSEGYNAPGSPYWALKSFILLAADKNHPFWKAEEKPMPSLPEVSVQPQPGMIVCRDKNGDVTLLTSGQYTAWTPVHYAEKFEKFAYSSVFGFSVPRAYDAPDHAAPDSMLAFLKDGMVFVRRKCESVNISDGSVKSVWSPLGGVRVETVLTPCPGGHIRRHKIVSQIRCEALYTQYLPRQRHA